jgi:Zn-dependent protease with chaperone function
MQMIFQLMVALLISTAWTSAVTAATVPTEAFVDRCKRVARVQAIARKLLVANVGLCPQTRTDFGFSSLSLDPGKPSEGFTIIATSSQDASVQSELRVGDVIVSANGVRWQSSSEGQRAFFNEMRAAQTQSQLRLGIRRDNAELLLTVPAQRICIGDIGLTLKKRVNAWATGTTIMLEGGVERLLASDDELAWVIAHEMAHIVLGHTDPAKSGDRTNAQLRSIMERDADALSMRLMLRAGFAPEAAGDAQVKIAKAGRGPISQLLDITGPYMKTGERNRFLRAQASEARAESR